MKLEKRTSLTTLLAVFASFCLTVGICARPEAARAADDDSVQPASPADQSQAADTAQSAEADVSTNATAKAGSEENASSPDKASDGIKRGPVVVFGENAELKAGETADTVVVIGGSAKVRGKVREAVVVIGGDADVDSDVGQEVVAVMGGVKLGSNALVHGDVVSVGGRLEIEQGAQVKGQTQEVPIAGFRLPHGDRVQKWVESCLFMLRPLSPRVGFVWVIAAVYFLLFLLISAVFRRPVEACINELERRPATTFLIGLLTKLFLPLLILLLIIIVIGIVVIPFLAAGLFVLGLVGKVAVLEWMGFKLGRLFGKEPLQQPVLALIIGSAALALLYMIPVIGLLTMLLLSVWSLGCAITATFGGFRRELPERAPAPPTPVYVPPPPPSAPPTMPGMSSEPVPAPSNPGVAAASYQSPTATMTAEPPVLPDTLAYPKATFWERIAAGFLDMVLVIILGAIVQVPPLALLVALAYFTGLWAWKGTSIGGIVLGLKVARADGQQLSFAAALVRALAAGFSAFVLFLGFFWIAWDPEKQGWHDKIAGTVVLKLPRGTPLVCF